MEKERKGLFGRLLDFWREKIQTGETDGIGFRYDTETAENHFAEMGAVAALTQEGLRKAFWEETAERAREKQTAGEKELVEETQIFFVPTEAEKGENSRQEIEETSAGRRTTNLFAAEVFQHGAQGTEETTESGLGKAFLWEMPEGKPAERSIVPVAEEAAKEKITVLEEGQEAQIMEMPKKEEKQTEQTIDIEGLMRQITKRLWEEREACGRRLR